MKRTVALACENHTKVWFPLSIAGEFLFEVGIHVIVGSARGHEGALRMGMNDTGCNRLVFDNTVCPQNILGSKDGDGTRTVQIAGTRRFGRYERRGQTPNCSPETEPKECAPFFVRIALKDEAFEFLAVGRRYAQNTAFGEKVHMGR